MKQIVIKQLRTDKALVFAKKYGLFKERLQNIGATIEDHIINYDESREKDVLSLIDEFFELKTE